MIAMTTRSSMSEKAVRRRWEFGVMTPSGDGPKAADDRSRPVDDRGDAGPIIAQRGSRRTRLLPRIRTRPRVGQAMPDSGDGQAQPDLLLEMFVEELLDRSPHFRGIEPRPAVTPAGDDVQGRFDAGLAERRVQQFALLEHHDRVLIAVNDEKRCRHFGNMSGGAGLSRQLLFLIEGAVEQFLEDLNQSFAPFGG